VPEVNRLCEFCHPQKQCDKHFLPATVAVSTCKIFYGTWAIVRCLASRAGGPGFISLPTERKPRQVPRSFLQTLEENFKVLKIKALYFRVTYISLSINMLLLRRCIISTIGSLFKQRMRGQAQSINRVTLVLYEEEQTSKHKKLS
jgi:hypothetical protein